MIKLVLPKFWYRRGIISYLLLPFSFVYRVFINVYRFYYQNVSLTKFPIPIIVVGNITVGGTGKTPLVIYLVELLKKQGYHPGVISRGYGRKWSQEGSIVVDAKSKVEEVGDEALLISRRVTCPIIVNINRVAAAKKLLKDYCCNVIISDDGLQHYKLSRDVEIVLIDAGFEFGNKFCLPAGPLREPISRLKHVDFVVRNFDTMLSASLIPGEYRMFLEGVIFHNVKNPAIIRAVDYFKGKIIHAVAGIGFPERFFKSLRQLNLNIIEHPFPDHYMFGAGDLAFADGIVIMTEKDAVKCDIIANDSFWYMKVNARLDNDFIDKLLDKLRGCDSFSVGPNQLSLGN